MITLAFDHKDFLGDNIWSFIFQPSQPLSWTAGQFIRIELPHAPADSEGTKRFFTIASAPHEQHIQIITRLTSSTFKQALSRLSPGNTLNLLDQPAGDFVWPESDQPLIFAAQGIGLTPFYSMLKSRLHQDRPLAAHLLYTNLASPARAASSAPAPFTSELKTWSATHPEFHLNLSSEPITAARLAAGHPRFAEARIYISGPGTIIELLGPPYNLPASSLKQDFFPNYSSSSY